MLYNKNECFSQMKPKVAYFQTRLGGTQPIVNGRV